MISFFRRVMTSWVMLGLLAVLVVAFAVTGIGTDPFGSGGAPAAGALAKAGGQNITERQFADQFDRFVKRAREQNPAITNAEAVKQGAVEGLLGQLEGRAALEAFAKKVGVSISERAVDGEIASIPAFQIAGKFDQAAYQRALATQRISEKDLRNEVRGGKLSQQLLAPVAIGGTAPRLLAAPYASLLLEARRGSIAVIPSARFAAGLTPTEAQLTSYYRANVGRYTLPERRALKYAIISKEAIAAATVVSDADIQKYYGERKDLYGGIPQRSLSQVVIADKAIADKIAARVKAGEDFAKIAGELAGYGAEDIALGTQTQEALAKATSPAVAAAAFAAAPGSLAGPIQSTFGWHVLRVDAVVPTKVRPLATVRAEIVAELTGDKADDALAKQVAEMEDALAQGESLADVAKSHQLTVQTTPPMTRDGRVQDTTFRLEPSLVPLVAKVFAADPEEDATVEQLSPDRLALLDVGDVVPPTPIALDRIRPAVAADWIRAQSVAKAKAAAESVAADVTKGQTLAAALASRGLPAPQQVGGRRIELGQNGQPVPPPVAMLFALPQGAVKATPAPNNAGWFVVQVDQVIPGNAEADLNILGGMQAQLSRGLPDELAGQFVRAIQREVGVSRDAKAVAAVKKRYLGTDTAGQ